jgi:hypothetical protein
VTSEELNQFEEYKNFDKKFQEKKSQKAELRFKPQGIINYYLPGETVRLI